jgi:hypothetical protein
MNMTSRCFQPKLLLGPPADQYERAADRVARQVTQATAARPATVGGGPAGRVLRKPDIQPVHGTGSTAVDPQLQRAIGRAHGGGRPLPGPVRGPMEQALGADFSRVRLHTDAQADQLTRSLRARAFTTGQDIFFRRGNDIASSPGRELLAHELTHVVQQSDGSASPQASGGGLIQRRMGFEFETTAQVRGTFLRPDGMALFDDEKEFYRAAGARWKIVPDEGRMEFVSDPLTTLLELQAVTNEIEAFIGTVRNVTRAADIRATHLGTWTAPAHARPAYTVHVGSGLWFNADVRATDWLGQPQVSVGLLTSSVDRFLRLARNHTTLASLRQQIRQLIGTAEEPPMPTKGIPPNTQNMTQLMQGWDTKLVATWLRQASVNEANNLVRTYAPQLPVQEQKKLRGLWELMRTYWNRLSAITVPGSYKKTQLTALARTDFHSFYNDLTPAGKAAFGAAAGQFAPPGGGVIIGTHITQSRWYASVIQPEAGSTNQPPQGNPRAVDLLSAAQSAIPGEEIATGTDKSMGQHPLDPSGGMQRAVFELRRITPGARIPIRLMYAHVLRPIFRLVQFAER